MKVRITVDIGSICLGVMVGLAIAPYFYGKKSLKNTMRKGAAKEVVKETVKETKKGLFGKKEKTDE